MGGATLVFPGFGIPPLYIPCPCCLPSVILNVILHYWCLLPPETNKQSYLGQGWDPGIVLGATEQLPGTRRNLQDIVDHKTGCYCIREARSASSGVPSPKSQSGLQLESGKSKATKRMLQFELLAGQ